MNMNISTLIDGFHSIFSLGNWRPLHHHASSWLFNIHITWHLCPPVRIVNYGVVCHSGCRWVNQLHTWIRIIVWLFIKEQAT